MLFVCGITSICILHIHTYTCTCMQSYPVFVLNKDTSAKNDIMECNIDNIHVHIHTVCQSYSVFVLNKDTSLKNDIIEWNIEKTQSHLNGVDGHHTEYVKRRSVAEEDVNKRDNLQGFPQSHGVGQNAAEPRTGLKPRQTLDDVVVQEPDPSDLSECVCVCVCVSVSTYAMRNIQYFSVIKVKYILI